MKDKNRKVKFIIGDGSPFKSISQKQISSSGKCLAKGCKKARGEKYPFCKKHERQFISSIILK